MICYREYLQMPRANTFRCPGPIPSDAQGQYLANKIRRAIPGLGPIFYLDTWPFSSPILFVISPQSRLQFIQEHPLPKADGLRTFLRPLAGEFNLLTMEGEMWKTWQSIFNPGFSTSHLNTLVPEILEETLVFRDLVQQRIDKADIFPLEDLTINLTLDILVGS